MGGALIGIDGVPVEVEVRISSQLPRVDVVGLPEAAVRESAARVRAAIRSIGLPFPDRRVTVNLAPAGELALDGRVRGVRGALAQVLALGAAGCTLVVAPSENAAEVALAPGIDVRLAATLADVVAALRDGAGLAAPVPARIVAAPSC